MTIKTIRKWLLEHPQIRKFEQIGTLPEAIHDKWQFYRAVQAGVSSLPRFFSKTAQIAQSAEIVGNVYIGAQAKIFPNVFIEGPAYIGRGVIVGNSTLVRAGSFLSHGSLLGNHCHCTASLFAPNARVAHFCGVSRSILEVNVYVSAFVITATVRPDFGLLRGSDIPDHAPRKLGCIIGPNTCVAPHVTIAPGIHIGGNCFIGSFVVVNKSIPDGKRWRLSGSIVIDDNPIEVRPRSSALEVAFSSKPTRGSS